MDGDYTAPSASSSSSSSGGGGGGGGAVPKQIQTEKSEATIELVRGKEQTFQLIISNKHSSPLERINITVSGINSKYIDIIPQEISMMEPYDSKNVTIKINAPSYFNQGEYKLVFKINGAISSNSTSIAFVETRIITLHIIEITREEAMNMLNESEKWIEKMNNSKINIKNVNLLLERAKENYKSMKFIELKEGYDNIKNIYEDAFSAKKTIDELYDKIKKSENEGITIIETKKMLFVAETAFSRGDFKLALERLKEAKLTYALETKGEFNIMRTIKNNPLKSAGFLLGLIVFGKCSLIVGRLTYYKKKLKLLGEEEKLLLELMKVVQRECFEGSRMSMEEYGEAMNQYETRLSQAIEERVSIGSKLANMLKIKGKKKALDDEKSRLILLIKDVQDKYLNKNQIETRIYQNMIKNYSLRLSEIEEQITFLEADELFKEKNIINRIMGAIKIK